MEALDALLQRNNVSRDDLEKAVYDTLLLVLLKRVLLELSHQPVRLDFNRRLRAARGPGSRETIWTKFLVEATGAFLGEDELYRLRLLATAFLERDGERGKVDDATKKRLLERSGYRCEMCGQDLRGKSYDLDHVVPFTYVGDRLDANWQILCPECNKAKGSDLVYMMRMFFKKVGRPHD